MILLGGFRVVGWVEYIAYSLNLPLRLQLETEDDLQRTYIQPLRHSSELENKEKGKIKEFAISIVMTSLSI